MNRSVSSMAGAGSLCVESHRLAKEPRLPGTPRDDDECARATLARLLRGASSPEAGLDRARRRRLRLGEMLVGLFGHSFDALSEDAILVRVIHGFDSLLMLSG